MDPSTIAYVVASLVAVVKGTLLVLGILVVGWVVSKWVNRGTRRAFQRRKLDAALGNFLATALQYTVIAMAAIAAMGSVGIHTTSLVAILASAGFAVGLALQGSLESFASGVMLLVFRPFDIDHVVTAAGQTGVVKDIGLFATTLITADNQVILVPNKEVTKGSIVNSTALGKLRGAVPVTVDWSSDPATLTRVLLEAAKASPLVLADPAPDVVVTGVTRTLDATLYVWAKSADLAPALARVRTAVHDGLVAAGMKVPPADLVVQVPR